MANKCLKNEGHSYVGFINNSSNTIYVLPHVSDTLIPIWVASYKENKGNYVNPYASKQIYATSRHGLIETDGRINPYLYIFVLDMQVLENYPIDTIMNNYMILQRYDLTISDLQRLDWQIVYPPNEAMKDVKMYPPYNVNAK
jgi:hypothetical protein